MPHSKPDRGESLQERFPSLCKEWHSAKNGSLKPSMLKPGSNKKVWWQCNKSTDHIWQAQPNLRTKGNGCPFCRGLKVAKSNCLSTTHPQIAKQWHKTKNASLRPTGVTKGSAKRVWWQCTKEKSHSWQMPIAARTGQNQGCPYCSNRRASITNNLKHWCLSNGDRGKKVMREYVAANNLMTIDELTSNSHVNASWKCSICKEHWTASPNRRISMLSDCPYCSGHKVGKTNNLKAKFPVVAQQWHPKKNGQLLPTDVSPHSNKRVWWKCDSQPDHVWQANVASKTSKGDKKGCPFCQGLMVAKSNCLSTTHPQIARQWHPIKNSTLKPSDITGGSSKKVWWQCVRVDSHSWLMTPSARTSQNQGCPYCANRRVSESNSLATKFPHIAQLLDQKRSGFAADGVISTSTKIAWWKCPNGDDHQWRATVLATVKSKSCPYCPPHITKLSKTNSLAGWCKNNGDFGNRVLSEWDKNLNRKISPETVIYTAQRIKIHWQCSVANDHKWVADPYRRTIDRQTCPFCSRRKASSTNNLLARYPELAKCVHPSKNTGIDLSEISPNNHLKLWWKCPNGEDHVFKSSVNAMKGKFKCGFCDGKRVSNTNSLQFLNPELAAEWHPTKNQTLTPQKITGNSRNSVWWKCKSDSRHEWTATVGARNAAGTGCPYCVIAPRSRREIFLNFELENFFSHDPMDHKLRIGNQTLDVDILIREKKLIIEYDGSYWHREKFEKDKAKAELLRKSGWTVIRIRERPLLPTSKFDISTDDREPIHNLTIRLIEQIEKLTTSKIKLPKTYAVNELLIGQEKAQKYINAYLSGASYATSDGNQAHLATWKGYFNELHELGQEPTALNGSSKGLIKWVRTQRVNFIAGKLSNTQLLALESLTFWTWEQFDQSWENNYRDLVTWINKNGTAHIPQVQTGKILKTRSWIVHQRVLYKKGKINQTKIQRLEALTDWSWSPEEDSWNSYLAALRSFAIREGHARVNQDHFEDDIALGRWVNKQRTRHRRSDLEEHRVVILESVPGWIWEPKNLDKDFGFQSLRSFVDREGHARVPAKHVEDGFNLGQWVVNRRQAYKAGKISEDENLRLSSFSGWAWKIR